MKWPRLVEIFRDLSSLLPPPLGQMTLASIPYSDKLSTLVQREQGVEKKVVYIETLGCQMNVADSERAATRLRAAGYEMSDSPESANYVILNTCSIREKAERKVFHRIDDIRRERAGSPPVIGLMGCVAQLEGEAIFGNAPAVRLVGKL